MELLTEPLKGDSQKRSCQMFEKVMMKKITAILLTLVMVMSVPVCAAAEDAGEEPDAYANEYTVDGDTATDAADIAADEGTADADAEAVTEPEDGAADGAEEAGEVSDAAMAGEPSDAADAVEGEEPALAGEEDPVTPPEEVLPEIKISAAGEDGKITTVWSAVEGAEYYIVRLDEDQTGTKIVVSEDTALKTVLTAAMGTNHTITVEAFRSNAEAGAEDIAIARGVLEDVKPSLRNRISKSGISPANLGINLRDLIREPYDGYAVVQGGVTDGIYAYSMMVSSFTQKGRLLKTIAGTDSVMARSDIINICHGNGMALNTKDRLIVVNGREDRRNQVTVISADTLKAISYVNLDYSYPGDWHNNYMDKGISSISYIPKYDCYLGLQRNSHEILVMNKSFKVIGKVGTTITSKYPGVYQAMDADERYVYLVLSAHNAQQPYNLILVLDWNSENLLDVLNGNAQYVSKRWMCNNDGSGTPDSVIRINTPYEAENLYHIDQGDGTSKFYLSEYYNNPQYKTVTKKKTVKVKWKKVRKKVKVKWKRVKVNGKWKWKYKYKWKKVWKYKKKKKKYKVRKFTHLNRDNYVYDLGSF